MSASSDEESVSEEETNSFIPFNIYNFLDEPNPIMKAGHHDDNSIFNAVNQKLK